MDELLHHCLRELSFDGDLGSNVSRLRDFIDGFYTHAGTAHMQNLDSAFCSFVWSLVVQQPAVRVGTIPPGASSEVWVAPQVSAKRKAKAKGEESIDIPPPTLDLVVNAKARSLDDLQAEYGERLRVAMDPDAIYEDITGSHVRFSKMSPMVYSALQIITRGRENGVSVVDLGQQSKYDQKTCFYLIKQLTELNLVVKVRRGGVGTHFCIHKYFFDRNPHWKAIRDEETQADGPSNPAKTWEDPALEEEESLAEADVLGFTPIDARHLSSLPLIRGRIVKLLKASKNNMYTANNLLITLGFTNPTKTDRRFFQTRVRELIQQGVIEKVILPSNKKPGASVKCFRLLADERSSELVADDADIAQLIDDDDNEDEGLHGQGGLKTNLTVHKQISDLLEEAGTEGQTLNGLSTSLCHFDRRTIELFLARAEKFPPPLHLSDLRVVGLMETSGRERRHRYFTASGYQALIAQENLDKSSAGFVTVDLESAGGFLSFHAGMFYQNEYALHQFQDSFKERKKNPKDRENIAAKKRGRPRKIVVPHASDLDDIVVAGLKKRKREQTPPEGVEGLSRPRKAHVKMIEIDKKILEEPFSQSIPKKRGRPPKTNAIVVDLDSTSPSSTFGKRGSKKRRANPFEIEDLSSTQPLRKDTTESLPSTYIPAQDSSGHPESSIGPLSMDSVIPNLIAENDRDNNTTPTQENSTDIVTATPRPILSRTTSQDRITSIGLTSAIPIDPLLLVDNLESSAIVSLPASTTPALLNPSMDSNKTLQSEFQAETPLKSKINVSHLRRENEFIRVIEKLGGIVNIQTKEFYDEHTALLEALFAAGEPASAPPGTRTDRRTAIATFDNLKRRNRIKELRTSVVTHTGVNRSACIAYLPDIDQQKLATYLSDLPRGIQPLSQPGSIVRIEEKLEYGGSHSTSTSRPGTVPFRLSRSGAERSVIQDHRITFKADGLFVHEDAKVQEVLLTERTTLSQLYGFIVGKALRARALHLHVLHAFESGNTSPHIISLQQRIVDISFFCLDIPLKLYSSLISSLTHDEELVHFTASPEGCAVSIRDLPANLRRTLQVEKSRPRSRFMDILEVLRLLGIVTPIQPATSGAPQIVCNESKDHPTCFDEVSDAEYNSMTSMSAPSYWKFNDKAPLRLWSISEIEPPFWKSVSVATVADTVVYWDLLRQVCTDILFANAQCGEAITDKVCVNIGLAKSLRRSSSWNPLYVFTWHQKQFLKQFVNVSTGSTPLEDADGESKELQMQRLCWVTSAPREAIETYFRTIRVQLLKEIGKLSAPSEKNAEKLAKSKAKTKLSLAKRSAEAREAREEEWKILLHGVCPGIIDNTTFIRLDRVRLQFLQAGSIRDTLKWEKRVVDALKEAELAAKTATQNDKRITFPRSVPATPVGISPVVNSLEPPVKYLIEQQGPAIPLEQREGAKKRNRKKGAKEEKPVKRHRFQWTREYDELARDAYAIISSRCRNLPRLDWSAYEQVFPAVPRNTVRQRMVHLKDTPGSEAYLTRLEDRWNEIWLTCRGTDALPDGDPLTASNFDLVKHVEFLRRHVDKNALRVGFTQVKEAGQLSLPQSVDELFAKFNVVEAPILVPEWDFMWNAVVEEGREKRLSKKPFTKWPEEVSGPFEEMSDGILLAESALKMTMGMPPECYDSERASVLLRSADDKNVSIAIKHLLSQGILSKSQRDPSKQKPGRQLKISENNQNAIGGFLNRDVFQDAAALNDSLAEDSDWRDWPLTATDGDNAALIQLASENRISFKVDTTLAQAARIDLDWNSKKADDDQMETTISVRGMGPLPSERNMDIMSCSLPVSEDGTGLTPGLKQNNIPFGHGKTLQAESACCSLVTDEGVIDCVACLEDEWVSVNISMGEKQRVVAKCILEIVHQTGEAGLAKAELETLCARFSREDILGVIHRMTECEIPCVYWVGYNSVVLVSALFVKKWTVTTSENPLIRSFPRRWLDMSGSRIADFWDAAIRAVIGVIIFRPGISLNELRWRLRSVYDRQEVNEVLHELIVEGFVRVSCDASVLWDSQFPYNDAEEKRVFLFLVSEKHWYEV